MWKASPLPIAQTVEAMAKFYSVAPGSNVDEFVDVAKKKFPNATHEDRRRAWRLADRRDQSLFIAWDAYPMGVGSFNSWDFARVPEWKPKPLPQPKQIPTWT